MNSVPLGKLLMPVSHPFPIVGASLLLAAAGCFSSNGSAVTYYEASSPVVFPPEMNYTGGVFEGQGHAKLWIDATHDRAWLELNLSTLNGLQLATIWTHVEGRALWQSRGLATNIEEGGASGHDGSLLPEVTAIYAGWGCANFTAHGQLLRDPPTGVSCLSARFLVTEQGVLAPSTHHISKQDGSPYDSRTPIDGKTYPGQRELHVEVSGPGAEQTDYRAYDAPMTQDFKDTATGTAYTRTFLFHLTGYMNQLHVSATADLGGAGQLTFTVRDPQGRTMAATTITSLGRGGGSEVPFPFNQWYPEGNYTVTVNGAAANLPYTVRASDTVPFPAHIYIIFTKVSPATRASFP